MIIKDKLINESYENYRAIKNDNWDFGNSILYDLCKKYPHHDNEHEIVAKIWLIGRSYSAAIERTKEKRTPTESSEDFYYDIVAPEMLKIGGEIDDELKGLTRKTSIKKNISNILRVHKTLVDTFCEISKFEKRSLASKYLHFHCPDLFFIYDSRSSESVNKIIQRPDKSIISLFNKGDYDLEYAEFVCRMIYLKKYLEETFKEKLTPRDLDTYLLSGEIKKVIEKRGK